MQIARQLEPQPWLIVQIRPETPENIEAFEFIENASSREEAVAEFLRRAIGRWEHHPIHPNRLGAIRATTFDGLRMGFSTRDLISYCATIGLPPSERKALLSCFEEIFDAAYEGELEARNERDTGIPLIKSRWGKP